MGQGMHTDMPVQYLGEHLVERCRRAWWTAYVLDREMTSSVGLPQSVIDDDIHPQLPNFAGSVQRSAALNMQIKLSASAQVGLVSSIHRHHDTTYIQLTHHRKSNMPIASVSNFMKGSLNFFFRCRKEAFR